MSNSLQPHGLYVKVKVKSLRPVRLFATPWTVTYQAPPTMGFPRQECWNGLPFPFQEIFPTQGSKPGLLHCRQTLYHLSHQGSPMSYIVRGILQARILEWIAFPSSRKSFQPRDQSQVSHPAG